MKEEELVLRAIAALLCALGPVDATQFLTLPHRRQRDAVPRHREWQKTLDPKDFLDQVFD